MPPVRSFAPYVVVTALLWGAVLPGVLVADAGGLVWRSPLLVGGAVVVALAGLVLLVAGAANLARAGVGLFTVRPGARLVTDGLHGRIRNPIDVGTVAIAVGGWWALDVTLGWVVPAAAVVSFVAGVGPYEDRLLLEEFGDDFRAYRRRVRKWVPRVGR